MHFPSTSIRAVISISAVILGATTVAAMAVKLPKGATPLSADEVRLIYSGKTGVYRGADTYYDPNGTTRGVFGKPKAVGTFKGTWTVKGNELCEYNKSKTDTKASTNCNAFWRVGNKIYALWSVHFDGSKPDKVNDYWVGEVKQHKKGDLVSKKYAAMGGE
ncbi:DUF995 domain-containing protein [Mesorhizobium sp. B2-4-6]|uniref:DUF995 domain-containing protein n=1 Tax=Mesorhizobium sp. B2-4-6 TaxID=2589943 RepID=UPI0015E40100|nr:DUF995 domain-containing protein [Mesorhizobium sp. B2-4-6]